MNQTEHGHEPAPPPEHNPPGAKEHYAAPCLTTYGRLAKATGQSIASAGEEFNGTSIVDDGGDL